MGNVEEYTGGGVVYMWGCGRPAGWAVRHVGYKMKFPFSVHILANTKLKSVERRKLTTKRTAGNKFIIVGERKKMDTKRASIFLYTSIFHIAYLPTVFRVFSHSLSGVAFRWLLWSVEYGSTTEPIISVHIYTATQAMQNCHRANWV